MEKLLSFWGSFGSARPITEASPGDALDARDGVGSDSRKASALN